MAFQTIRHWRGLGASSTAYSSQTQAIANAIANAEGYGVAGAIPTVRNNPGDIKVNGVIQTYATPQDGWNALYNQVNLMITGQSSYYNPSMTWSQIGTLYSGSSSPNWSNNVAANLGVDPNSTLGDYMGGASSSSTYAGLNPVTTGGSTDSTSTDTTLTDTTQAGTFDWTWLAWGGAAALALYFFVDMAEG